MRLDLRQVFCGLLLFSTALFGLPTESHVFAADGDWTLPGQQKTITQWPKASLPFDVDSALAVSDHSRTVTSDYLQALAEFSPDLYACAPRSADIGRRKKVADRIQRFNQLIERLAKTPDDVTNREVDKLLAEFNGGFVKLRSIKSSRQFTFETGLDFQTGLPHLDGARNAVRVGMLRVQRLCRKGDIDDAIDDIELLLGLSRDLRPRGFVISQIVSIGMDSLILNQMVTEVLRSEDVRHKHCERLLRVTVNHAATARDPFKESVTMDYILVRRLMNDVQNREGMFSAENLKRVGVKNNDVGTAVGMLLGLPADGPEVKKLTERLGEMDTEAYRRELQALNASTLKLSTLKQIPFQQFSDEIIEIEVARMQDCPLAADLDTGLLAVGRAVVRWRAQLGGTQCLLALRRYELLYPKDKPESLLQAIRSAGGRQVPIDAYSGGPMKMAEIDGALLVYSVGIDGIDQSGKMDWKAGSQPGDFLFTDRISQREPESRKQ